MTNHFGLKIIQVFCDPELFRLIRRAKGENILLDAVKWVVQLNNYRHDIRNSKRSSLIHFVELEQGTHNPSKNVTYFMISDLFQDKV